MAVVTRLFDNHNDALEAVSALERAGVVESATVVPLHVSYLREKLNVRSV